MFVCFPFNRALWLSFDWIQVVKSKISFPTLFQVDSLSRSRLVLLLILLFCSSPVFLVPLSLLLCLLSLLLINAVDSSLCNTSNNTITLSLVHLLFHSPSAALFFSFPSLCLISIFHLWFTFAHILSFCTFIFTLSYFFLFHRWSLHITWRNNSKKNGPHSIYFKRTRTFQLFSIQFSPSFKLIKHFRFLTYFFEIFFFTCRTTSPPSWRTICRLTSKSFRVSTRCLPGKSNTIRSF